MHCVFIQIHPSINYNLPCPHCTQKCAVASTLLPQLEQYMSSQVESLNHEELRHVGLTPIALCELMSREQARQNDFAVVKCILP